MKMKKILSGMAFAVAVICLASSAAMANPTCTAEEGMNVLGISACDLGGLTFSNFQVSGSPNPPGSTVFLSSAGTGVGGDGTVDLGFQITTGFVPSPLQTADTILQYTVSGTAITGVDNQNGGQTGTIIEEKVCTVAFTGSVCMGGTLLADFTTSGNASNSVTFGSQTKIYILKDIEQSNANSFISSFVNSHEVPTPEPASLSMMGLGLLGLGLIGRRKRKV
jgi:hypothetical protein